MGGGEAMTAKPLPEISPCPWCGRECELDEDWPVVHLVSCAGISCCYTGPVRRTKRGAVVAHNKRIPE
jgi:hypothetical protein